MESHGIKYAILFSFSANKERMAEQMEMKMSEMVQNVTKKEPSIEPIDSLLLILLPTIWKWTRRWNCHI